MNVWTWVASVTIFFLLVHIRKAGQNHKACRGEVRRLKIAAGEIEPEPLVREGFHSYDLYCVCNVCSNIFDERQRKDRMRGNL